MMDPNTGEIIAMANRPTYDPNAVGDSDADKRRNRAITDVYEPGSTFKAFMASAAIEEKIVSLNEKFDVSRGFIKIPGGLFVKTIGMGYSHLLRLYKNLQMSAQ